MGIVSRLFGIEGDTRVILGGMLNLLPVCFMGICMKNYKAVQSIPFWHYMMCLNGDKCYNFVRITFP